MKKKHVYLIVFCLLFAIWHFYAKNITYKYIYGKKSERIYQNEPLDVKINILPDNQPIQTAKLNGYDIKYKFRASYQGWQRMVYIDVYEYDFHIGRKTRSVKLNDFYNKVSPLDLSLLSGETAQDGNWQKIDISHEYRLLKIGYRYEDAPIVKFSEYSNLHILPANKTIRRGLDTIRKGDIIFIKGWLLDFFGIGEFNGVEFTTALGQSEISDDKYGGKIAGKCYYLFVTELIVGDYIFK